MKTIQHRQTIASQGLGILRLSGLSPYFPTTRSLKFGGSDRVNPKKIILMRIGYIISLAPNGDHLQAYVLVQDSVTPANNTCYGADVFISSGESAKDVMASVESQITTYLAGVPIDSLDSYTWLTPPPLGLLSAPQASIANAPADAVTNYNVVTTLLGGLTGAVNTANTKQNDIATKLNSLLAELRTLGLISA